MGAAFFLWDKALKLGDARQMDRRSDLTPQLSAALLVTVRRQPLTWNLALAARMMMGAAVLGTRAR